MAPSSQVGPAGVALASGRIESPHLTSRRDPRRGVDLLSRTLTEAAHDRITTSAASLAFHLFLAFFPAVVAALGLIGLVGLSASQLQSVIHDIGVLLPAQMAQTLDQALHSPASRTGGTLELVFGVAVALWSSIEAMASLQVGLDVAYEVTRDRGFLGRRLMAIPLIVLTGLLGGGASVLLVLGNPLRSLLPGSFALARSTADAGWDALRWAGALFLVVLLLSGFYALGPNLPGERRRWFSVGAVVAAAGWLAASAAFSFYLDHFGHESRSYGAFAGVAVMLLWLFLTAVAVLLGAELNCELARDRGPGRAPESIGR